jgi:hypothetical protein
MEYPRGIYKEETFNGIVEYRVYDHNKCLISQARIVAYLATPETDEAFEAWLDMLDPEGKAEPVVTVASSVLSPPVSGVLAA